MDHLRLEFRKFRGDVGIDINITRKMGLRALPVAAAAVAGVAGLCFRKRSVAPDKDLLAHSASFSCGEVKRGGLHSGSVLEQDLERVGVDDISALQRAARRLRGPIERDLMVVECKAAGESMSSGAWTATRQRLQSELVTRWRADGHFAEPVQAASLKDTYGIDLMTQKDESYGRDVGSEVPLCLLRSEDEERLGGPIRTLGVEDWSLAADALEKHGVVCLRELISVAQVQSLRDRLGITCSALDHNRRSAQGLFPVRNFDDAALRTEDPELEPLISANGRKHYYLRGRALEEVVKHVSAGALPLIWEHMAKTVGASSSRRPYVSEVQLLVADPCAVDQFWHVDNSHGGVTLFVPLTAVPMELGPTLFLPGTHHLLAKERSWSSFVSSFLSTEGVACGVMEAGDALLYDSRTFHRCAMNRRYDRARVALVFRYDVERPPGFGTVGIFLVSKTGSFLSAFQRFYSSLPGAPAPQPRVGE